MRTYRVIRNKDTASLYIADFSRSTVLPLHTDGGDLSARPLENIAFAILLFRYGKEANADVKVWQFTPSFTDYLNGVDHKNPDGWALDDNQVDAAIANILQQSAATVH